MGISVTQLAIILLIAVVLFGTKRLRGIGSDLGSAINGFRSAVRDGEESGRRIEADHGEPTDTLASETGKVEHS